MLEFKADSCLQARGHQGRLGDQQRHGLALHVGTHQGAVGVVVFQEGDQAGGDAHHLGGGHVDVLHLAHRNHLEVAMMAGDNRVAHQAAVLDQGVGRGQNRLVLLIRPQPLDVLGQLAILELLIGGHEEAVLVHAGVDGQAGDQADVRAFRGFDGADAAVVGNVDVADLEARPLAVQTARPQGREPPLVREHRQGVGLVDHLRQLAAAEEVFDRRGDAFRVDQAARRHVLQIFEAHPLLNRPPQLEEALAQLVGGQLVDGPQPPVAQVVDVVDLRVRLVIAQPQQVLDGRDKVVGTQRHLRLGDVQSEFAVDAEAAHPSEAIAVGVVEFLVKQGLGLFQLGRIARPQALVNPQQRLFVAGGVVVAQGVQQQRILRVAHHLDLLQARGADRFGGVLSELLGALDDDFAGPRTVGGINDVADRQLPLELRGAAAIDDFDDFGGIEHAQQVGIVAVVGVHRPQQRHDRELAALVDADGETLFAVDVQLDPTAAFGNDAATLQPPLAGAFDFADEVDAGAAVELADDHPLGPVDDELTPAEHDGDIAQIDLFLDGLLLGQPQPNLERPAVGQTQLATLVRLVARLSQLVADILQAERLVVALDGENFAQYALDPLVLSLRPGGLVLQEGLVAAGLDFRQIGDGIRGSQAAKATSFLGLEPSLSRGGHKGSPSSEQGNVETPVEMLLDGNRGAGFFQLFLQLFSVFLGDAFFDLRGNALDQVLGFFQPQAGRRADHFDHADLPVAKAFQDHVEFGLFDRRRGAAAVSRSGHHHSAPGGRLNAVHFFQVVA